MTKMRIAVLVALVAGALPSLCADYSVAFDPAAKSANVTIKIATPSVSFSMPAWSPGDYRIVNYGKNLQAVVFSRERKTVESAKASTNSWSVPSGADEVRYTVPAVSPGIFSENLRINANEAFMHGPAVLGYFADHMTEAQTLTLSFPGNNVAYECALPSTSAGVFKAPDYDTLIDSPAVMGTAVRSKEFVVQGKPHKIVGFGRAESANLEQFAAVATRIIEQAFALMGELPYDRYYFLLDFGGPGGGLEHLNCTRIAMWPGLEARLAANFLSHEYFHAFNVKRIRAKPLGPFDYSNQAITGSLWWAEGVTDYYAEILSFRAGLQTKDDTLSSFSQGYRSLSRNPARLKVSADESSRRVWEANNSSGFGDVDYYEKGKLIGLTLDVAIRAESKGSKSLDDVMRALYAETKGGKPGFSETRIRELCVQFGGPALGPIYDKCVLQAVELPLAEVLPGIGYALVNGRISPNPKATAASKANGDAWLKSRA